MSVAHAPAAGPGPLVLAFADAGPHPVLPWDRLTAGLVGGAVERLVVEPGWPRGDVAGLIQALAARAQGKRPLVCAGMGVGAVGALIHGRLLGAHAILAVAPGAGLGLEGTGGDLDDLAALFEEDDLAVGTQFVEVVAAEDSLKVDLAVAERLRRSGVTVRVRPAKLPSEAIRLAALQSGWTSAWLAAAVADEPGPVDETDLASIWRAAFDFDLSIDLEGARQDSAGALRLDGRICARSDRPLDLRAAAEERVSIGVCAGSAEVADGPRAYVPLPSVVLAPGETVPVQIRLEKVNLDARGFTLHVGLASEGRFWLDAYGFPATTVRLAGDAGGATPFWPMVPPAAPNAPPAGGLGAASTAVVDHGPAGPASDAPPAATRSDVIACYRTFLGREPESEAVVAEHLAKAPHLWPLVDRIRNSLESARWRLHEALVQIGAPSGAVEIDASAVQMAELAEHIDMAWARHGGLQPYFSAVPHPDYLAALITPERIDAFYASGAEEIEAFRGACRRNRVEPDPAWSVLELGCRAGRLGEAFARTFGGYTGVDVCPEQLAIAEDRFRSRGCENARTMTMAEFLAGGDEFDLFFSVLALQHYPPPILHARLEAALGKVRPGGYAYFQLPGSLYDYRFSTDTYLVDRIRHDPNQLHALPQRHVFTLLAKCGFTPIEARLDTRVGPRGLSHTFLAHKLADRSHDA